MLCSSVTVPSSTLVWKFKSRPAPLAILFFCRHHEISLSFVSFFAAFGAMLFFLRQAKLLRGRLSSSRSPRNSDWLPLVILSQILPLRVRSFHSFHQDALCCDIRFKSCCFLGKNVGKTLFSVSDLLVKKNICVGRIRFVFPLFLIFSLFVPLFFSFIKCFLHSFFHHFLFLFITFRTHHCLSFPFLLDHLCS